jgi:hypothetical protein
MQRAHRSSRRTWSSTGASAYAAGRHPAGSLAMRAASTGAGTAASALSKCSIASACCTAENADGSAATTVPPASKWPG